MLVILAEAQWKAGEWDDAFATIASGKRRAWENGEGLFAPELYRLEGEFLLEQCRGTSGVAPAASGAERTAGLASAERSIRESLFLARRQGASMLELRSLLSLYRVRAETGTPAEDAEELAKLYATFTEGFDTADLREARAVMDVLKA
jgi:adenylate cyclase